MSQSEIEDTVDRMLEQEFDMRQFRSDLLKTRRQRGDAYIVDAPDMRRDLFQKLLADLDTLGAEYKVRTFQSIYVKAPSDVRKAHEILTLFRLNDLEVKGL